MVTILYFAWVRERIGVASETLTLPPECVTLADVARWLSMRSTGHSAAFAAPEKLRAARDQMMVSLDTPVGDAREIAFFPPVTGG